MLHYPGHLLMGIAAAAATLLISNFSVNRTIKRKLKLSTFLFSAYVVVNLVVFLRPELIGPAKEDVDAQLRAFERLAFSGALINLEDRVSERVVSTFVFEEKLLTTSAVSAVVIGFAVEDTLGNAFAGRAIQSERPFHVGHWIRVGEFEGRVSEVTWRATKLRTKSGNFVILPNNLVAKEAVTNYSEPGQWLRSTKADTSARCPC
jgi:small-conductance mechanosensitive channel